MNKFGSEIMSDTGNEKNFFLIISGNLIKFNYLSSRNSFCVTYCCFIFPPSNVMHNHRKISTMFL